MLVLAAIAAAGSFTHIRDTAIDHGQRGWMAWAVAVCIDLTCVMAARERQRDKKTGRRSSGLSWPTLVLTGGVLLSLAANLAQAEATVWGWIVAGTPAAAFLVAVSMLERRATGVRPAEQAVPAQGGMAPPPSFGRPPSPSRPSPSSREVQDVPRPELTAVVSGRPDPGEQTALPVPEGGASPSAEGGTPEPAAPLVAFARRVAAEHQATHGRPITRDALRARLGVSNQLASELLRQVRDHVPA
ncbi:DUF2637 domain-containing protein [Actinomadura namibiensis]|uniref:DUF2637 domain-containing protein n=1 Tax=Actinomadura namibiensis TaxID=182080 RepID=A0A7W3LLA0_ACTNM|nr:DUF2637 domain-containing protein [Actinomadura namibiensis]MBA8950223.1 hypothetical protein [Actinomadura namibiensis]